jgi:hypothetical protein
MFGLEKQKKKKEKPDVFVFDLEKMLSNRNFGIELKNKIESRVQNIKEALRSGDEKVEFEKLGVLLHGYASLVKVFSRIGTEKKP